MCLKSSRVSGYLFISQGKTRIPGNNDTNEEKLSDIFLLLSAHRVHAIWYKISCSNKTQRNKILTGNWAELAP